MIVIIHCSLSIPLYTAKGRSKTTKLNKAVQTVKDKNNRNGEDRHKVDHHRKLEPLSNRPIFTRLPGNALDIDDVVEAMLEDSTNYADVPVMQMLSHLLKAFTVLTFDPLTSCMQCPTINDDRRCLCLF